VRFKENGVWHIFNWLNTENVQLTDPRHPFYRALDHEAEWLLPFTFPGDPGDFRFLKEKLFVVEDRRIISDCIRVEYQRITDPKRFGLILLPAGQACNFRCRYCYEDHEVHGMMGSHEHEVLLNFLYQHEFHTIHIEHFGGEPLLNTQFIFRFNQAVQELAAKRGAVFSSGITTNGFFLNTPTFRRLLENGVRRFQITLDGNPADHNQLRPLANGGPTFAIIYRNLRAISKQPEAQRFTITIRVNFNAASAAKSKRKEFIQRITEDFHNDQRFNFLIRPIYRFTGSAPAPDLYPDEDQQECLQEQYENDMQAVAFAWSEIPRISQHGKFMCYAALPGNLVVHPAGVNGEIPVQKCTIALRHPANQVGFFSPEGKLLINDNWERWVKPKTYLQEKCHQCFFVMQCLGNHCPWRNYKSNQLTCPKPGMDKIKTTKKMLRFLKRFAKPQGEMP